MKYTDTLENKLKKQLKNHWLILFEKITRAWIKTKSLNKIKVFKMSCQ